MPEALGAVLVDPGLPLVCLASLVAGLVYGFAGFGSALVFMPLATLFVPPPVAVAAFSLSALASLVTVVPGAWKVAEKRGVGVMIAACLVFTPLGVAALRLAPETAIRTAISLVTLGTLAALVAGFRLPVGAGAGPKLVVGALAGLTGGSTGLNGPPVILFNLGAGGQPVAVTRGNLAVFLTLTSLSFVPQLWLQGLLMPFALWLGLVLLVPYAAGTWAGARLFRPERAGFYRRFAYGLIGAAGLAALPIWS
ncbi:sulfite exporter TauE/SafE family protein [Roseibacterium sp. SDUM158017]|uniref:sulfite exporter TauE/SafE family protein n=1 Tax=Roseicyclus salinarum TaxID=3036773 RepID=UPI00241572E2|nr:sulfite exporter TauE/SafE family protein [Roseibacterium sp. SDUM158017]MDG4649154.1 sulfite exporter TauE/SafE family protein [Roseibacterium sp. SDUM158017]